MPSRSSASILPTSRPTIDITFTTACPFNETRRAYTKSRHQACAPSAEGRTVTTRNRTLAMTIGAVAILAGTIVAKPSPIYIWNGSESVPLGSIACGLRATATSPRFERVTYTFGGAPCPAELWVHLCCLRNAYADFLRHEGMTTDLASA